MPCAVDTIARASVNLNTNLRAEGRVDRLTDLLKSRVRSRLRDLRFEDLGPGQVQARFDRGSDEARRRAYIACDVAVLSGDGAGLSVRCDISGYGHYAWPIWDGSNARLVTRPPYGVWQDVEGMLVGVADAVIDNFLRDRAR